MLGSLPEVERTHQHDKTNRGGKTHVQLGLNTEHLLRSTVRHYCPYGSKSPGSKQAGSLPLQRAGV